MAEQDKRTGIPDSHEILAAVRNPPELVKLGDSVIEYIQKKPYTYETKWSEQLWKAVASLKDAIKDNVRINMASTELVLLLLNPGKISRPLTKAEIEDITEPTEDDIEAWAWGHDLAMTSKWFVGLVVFSILSILSFAVITFGLESPGTTITILFLSLGSFFLAAATALLGIGLYRLYVTRGYLSWEYKTGYPDAEVVRRDAFYRNRGWYAYTFGGIFLGISIGLVIVISQKLFVGSISDYTHIRLVFLSSISIGIILFAMGVWPIIRNIVATSEIDKRKGRVKYHTSPRVLIAILPIITGTISLIVNWLF
jgi:hypothetical protein